MDNFAWKHVPSNTFFGIQPHTARPVLTTDARDVFFFSEENQGVSILARKLNDLEAKFSDFECCEIKLP